MAHPFQDLLTPAVEIAWRIGRAQAAMAARGLDALFIAQNADLYYFTGTVQDGLLAIPAAGDPVFLVRRVPERAREESPLARIIPVETPRAYPSLLASQGMGALRRVGVELDVLPAALYLRQARAYPGVEFVDASDAIRMVRSVKRPWEVEQMRRAAEIQDRMVRRLCEVLHPGMTELDLAIEMEAEGRRAGHQGLVRFRRFNQEVFFGHFLTGENAARPAFTDAPTGGLGMGPALGNGVSRRRIRAHEPVLFDYNGCYNGYHSDQTRTLALGTLPEEMVRAHAGCREILEAAQAWLRPGADPGDVYARCVALAARLGYAEVFMGYGAGQVPYVGHGVGVEMDELPVLARNGGAPLEAGMAIAVEPKIVFPGRGMVGVEDVLLVGEGEATPLNVTPRDLIVIPM
ncbi:MAG TPA: Xaa-Pro peptidase family protein [Candidatus Methylomirabilis sp.]